MKLHEYVDSEKLADYINEGLISARKHPTYPLVILNYTPAAQGSKFDDTLSKCRGLVYEESTLDIYAIPFKKFWNYNDAGHPETLQENLPKGIPAIYEKVDGSLGVGFFYKDEFLIATRGSFESSQAKWAQNWVNQNIMYDKVDWADKIFTWLFEIVIPEDRKVVNYSYSGLVLLGETDFQGRSYHPYEAISTFMNNVRIARSVSYESLEFLQSLDLEDEEGYVATWFSGVNTFRVKIKFETYKRLHRMYFQTTTDVIWELIKSGEDIAKHLEGSDDSLKAWATGVGVSILVRKTFAEHTSKEEFRNCIAVVNANSTDFGVEVPEKERRKAFAFHATKSKHPQLLFLLYDGKLREYEEAVWKIVRPENKRFTKVEE